MEHRTLRVGLTAILWALVFRLCTQDLPARLKALEISPQTGIIETETGREVRFSPSLWKVFPDFVESPPPAGVFPEEEALPVFSDTETVNLTYFSTKKPDIDALLTRPLSWSLRGERPTVLILHTHSTESYTKGEEEYQETASWRTLDEDYNMLAIGEILQKELARRGILAIQDRQIHDYPSYNGSYTHARKSIQSYLKEYPDIALVLDLHRDATEGGRQLRTLAQAGGEDSAQLMLVVGANHSGYEENLSLALKLHAQLETQTPGITRPIQLRASRFNQDLCPGGLLIEVGAAGNSHQEARNAARELAKAIVALAEGTAEA